MPWPALSSSKAALISSSFANICRHRGVRVVDGGGETRRFTCPFHAWVYDLEGKLVGVPTPAGFEGMCRDEKGLVELPVDEGFGLIVGRLRPGPPVDIEEFLGPGITEELAALAYHDWQLWGDPHVHHVNTNWKVTLDTYRENYHFNHLHKDTLATWAYGGALLFDPFGLHLRNCTALRSIDEVRAVPDDQWGNVTRHFSYQYNFFPNTCLSFDARHVELWQILPIDEHTSEVLHAAYLRPDLTPQEHSLALDQMPWICSAVVDAQDFWVAARTEPGIRTGISNTVMLGRNEPTLQHLHRSFLSVLTSAKQTETQTQTQT
jgi:choline monooxygenase